MNTICKEYDSVMFDMDGTMWDAVESYCAIWNHAIDICCPGVPHVTYDTLSKLMGKPLDIIFDNLIGDASPREDFMRQLDISEQELMPRLGGKVYPGVKETVRELYDRGYMLFMVSNCTRHGLPNFLKYTGLAEYFTGYISFGDTGKEKDSNIKFLEEKYELLNPLYVGDTAGDCNSAHKAGVDFAWASYGFGHDVEGYEYKLDRITDLTDYVCYR